MVCSRLLWRMIPVRLPHHPFRFRNSCFPKLYAYVPLSCSTSCYFTSFLLLPHLGNHCWTFVSVSTMPLITGPRHPRPRPPVIPHASPPCERLALKLLNTTLPIVNLQNPTGRLLCTLISVQPGSALALALKKC